MVWEVIGRDRIKIKMNKELKAFIWILFFTLIFALVLPWVIKLYYIYLYWIGF